MRTRFRHLSVGLFTATTIGFAAAPDRAVQVGDTATFTITLRGARIGSEIVTVTRTPAGWVISMVGRQAPPIDLQTTKFEMTYGADWQPQRLSIEGTIRGQPIAIVTSFGVTTATTDLMQAGKRASATHQVSPRAIVLPDNFFASYEALAARLGSATIGLRLPIFVAPEVEIAAMVDRITLRRLATPAGPLDLRQVDLTFSSRAGPLAVEVWIDARNRLARLDFPAASLSVIREDVSSVMTRVEPLRNTGDEDVFIPSAGFALAATITKPAAGRERPPAVVLVSGGGPEDREGVVAGVPIFGQLAGALADAGVFVVRYDKRGVGQTGGRSENATLTEYAEDVVQIVRWLRRRRDIDTERIAAAGYFDGGAVALLAGSRTNDIRAIALLAAPGSTGRDITLEQQRNELAKLNEPEADRQAKLALQLRVIEAATTGAGWDAVPPAVRRSADTPWFRSWLLFDPAAALRKVDQPILVLHGALDTEVPPAHADRLEALATSRKRPPHHTRKIVIAGVNHLFAIAKTGDVEEYAALATKAVSPETGRAIAAWLHDVLPPRRSDVAPRAVTGSR